MCICVDRRVRDPDVDRCVRDPDEVHRQHWRAAPWNPPPGLRPGVRWAPVSAARLKLAPAAARTATSSASHSASRLQRNFMPMDRPRLASPWFVFVSEAIPHCSGGGRRSCPLPADCDLKPAEVRCTALARAAGLHRGPHSDHSAEKPRSPTTGRPRSAAAGPMAYDGCRI